MEIRVLGNIEIHSEGAPVYLARPTARAALAFLVLNLGRWVSVGELIDFAWLGNVSRNSPATASVGLTIRSVRSALISAGGDPTCIARSRDRLAFMLSVGPEVTDYGRYRLLTIEARAARKVGDRSAAIAAYRQALGTWTGRAFSDVPTSEAEIVRSTLDRERTELLTEMQNEQFHIGDFVTVADQVEGLLASSPYLLDETLITHGVHALAYSGRSEVQIQKFIDRSLEAIGSPVSRDFLSFIYRSQAGGHSAAQSWMAGHHNGLFGIMNGPVVQAGIIYGDVNIHNNNS